jgi:hypothetical protein
MITNFLNLERALIINSLTNCSPSLMKLYRMGSQLKSLPSGNISMILLEDLPQGAQGRVKWENL